jgi:hypothetical protein
MLFFSKSAGFKKEYTLISLANFEILQNYLKAAFYFIFHLKVLDMYYIIKFRESAGSIRID